ncbi:hypothetical protein E4T44_06152 [Aureobasidium sp. EXF-8845]|nr:hypothetical protein E4T44_06152 [Aureobasidium sp. EXF-8845]KAI4850215.1 hypothetical protein E4T45_05590 [Aureobasidium sp. EXF-8846]
MIGQTSLSTNRHVIAHIVYPPLFYTLDLPGYKRAELSASETDPSSLSDTSSDTHSKLNFSIDEHLKPNTTV